MDDYLTKLGDAEVMTPVTCDPFGLGNSASSDKFAEFDAYVTKIVDEEGVEQSTNSASENEGITDGNGDDLSTPTGRRQNHDRHRMAFSRDYVSHTQQQQAAQSSVSISSPTSSLSAKSSSPSSSSTTSSSSLASASYSSPMHTAARLPKSPGGLWDSNGNMAMSTLLENHRHAVTKIVPLSPHWQDNAESEVLAKSDSKNEFGSIPGIKCQIVNDENLVQTNKLSYPMFDESVYGATNLLIDPQITGLFKIQDTQVSEEILQKCIQQMQLEDHSVEEFASSLDPNFSDILKNPTFSFLENFIQEEINNNDNNNGMTPKLTLENSDGIGCTEEMMTSNVFQDYHHQPNGHRMPNQLYNNNTQLNTQHPQQQQRHQNVYSQDGNVRSSSNSNNENYTAMTSTLTQMPQIKPLVSGINKEWASTSPPGQQFFPSPSQLGTIPLPTQSSHANLRSGMSFSDNQYFANSKMYDESEMDSRQYHHLNTNNNINNSSSDHITNHNTQSLYKDVSGLTNATTKYKMTTTDLSPVMSPSHQQSGSHVYSPTMHHHHATMFNSSLGSTPIPPRIPLPHEGDNQLSPSQSSTQMKPNQKPDYSIPGRSSSFSSNPLKMIHSDELGSDNSLSYSNTGSVMSMKHTDLHPLHIDTDRSTMSYSPLSSRHVSNTSSPLHTLSSSPHSYSFQAGDMEAASSSNSSSPMKNIQILSTKPQFLNFHSPPVQQQFPSGLTSPWSNISSPNSLEAEMGPDLHITKSNNNNNNNSTHNSYASVACSSNRINVTNVNNSKTSVLRSESEKEQSFKEKGQESLVQNTLMSPSPHSVDSTKKRNVEVFSQVDKISGQQNVLNSKPQDCLFPTEQKSFSSISSFSTSASTIPSLSYSSLSAASITPSPPTPFPQMVMKPSLSSPSPLFIPDQSNLTGTSLRAQQISNKQIPVHSVATSMTKEQLNASPQHPLSQPPHHFNTHPHLTFPPNLVSHQQQQQHQQQLLRQIHQRQLATQLQHQIRLQQQPQPPPPPPQHFRPSGIPRSFLSHEQLIAFGGIVPPIPGVLTNRLPPTPAAMSPLVPNPFATVLNPGHAAFHTRFPNAGVMVSPSPGHFSPNLLPRKPFSAGHHPLPVSVDTLSPSMSNPVEGINLDTPQARLDKQRLLEEILLRDPRTRAVYHYFLQQALLQNRGLQTSLVNHHTIPNQSLLSNGLHVGPSPTLINPASSTTSSTIHGTNNGSSSSNSNSNVPSRECVDFMSMEQLPSPLTSDLFELVGTYPFYQNARQYSRSVACNDLHSKLEECYEQFKAMEKERKKTEAELARQNPGRKVSSTNSLSIPRLPPNPSRVDRLIVESFREHARVVTLVEKMEKLQSLTIHPSILKKLNAWYDSIGTVQAKRKDEIVNAASRQKAGKPRQMDDKDVTALAVSISDLTTSTRHARTAQWVALQMADKDNPQLIDKLGDGDPSINLHPYIQRVCAESTKDTSLLTCRLGDKIKDGNKTVEINDDDDDVDNDDIKGEECEEDKGEEENSVDDNMYDDDGTLGDDEVDNSDNESLH